VPALLHVDRSSRLVLLAPARKLCELVTAYVREVLKCTAPHLAGSIAVYRAGYSPAERREIERALFQGSLRAGAVQLVAGAQQRVASLQSRRCRHCALPRRPYAATNNRRAGAGLPASYAASLPHC
jgi:ATP-dependent helicase YprA (DUF1998 family)